MNHFKSINEFKKESELITILYPGGFKPLSSAHIYLINEYLKQSNVKLVVLFISPGSRDNVDPDKAYYIAKEVLKDKNVEVILDKTSYSPILSCYRWIEKSEREPGKYALAASSKGEDYKRVKEFCLNYSEDKFGKNLPSGVQIIEYPLDTTPLLYKNGPNKGEPISSTFIRQNIKDNDYESFKFSYPNLDEKTIQFIWNILTDKNKKENIEEDGSDIDNYSRIYPSQKYKSLNNIDDN